MKRKKKNAAARSRAEAGQLDLFGVEQAAQLSGSKVQEVPDKKPPKALSSRVANKNATETYDTMLGTKEAACKLGIGVSTLEKMRAQRRGPPFVRLSGSIVRYRLADLEAWVSQLTH